MSLGQYKDASRKELWEILQIQAELTKKLEAKLQNAQVEKIDAIAKERKRWAREDLAALEILKLEQQAIGIEDTVNDCAHSMEATQIYVADLDCRVVDLRNQAKALKATWLL